VSGTAVVDAHNDLLLELDHRRDEPGAFAARWLLQLRDGGVVLQVCPVFAGTRTPSCNRSPRTGQFAAAEELQVNGASVGR
jgi:microsomal dipeptidase-like Zn-dependent dipeptidase